MQTTSLLPGQERITRNAQDQEQFARAESQETPQINFKDECNVQMTCSWYELFLVGKLPNRRAYHVSFFWKNNFYVHGGQDLKEGSFSDLWKLNLPFLEDGQSQLKDEHEIYDIQWDLVKTIGTGPTPISHHAGVLQDHLGLYIIYGGLISVDSNETIYLLNLNKMGWEAVLPSQQKEKNGGMLPGPRDDFVFVSPSNQSQDGAMKPMFLIGGFKNGEKMNDIYRLESPDNKQFIWERIQVKNQKVQPEPRSGFAGDCSMSEDGTFKIFIFGGACEGNDKQNDLWKFEGENWEKVKANCDMYLPQERSGHQMSLYKDRYLLIFGGILEVTNELNDLHLFDLVTGKWHTIEEDNKNASQSGSPKNKALSGSDSFKKQYQSMNLSATKKFGSRISDSPARSITGAQKLENSTFQKRSINRGKSPNNKSMVMTRNSNGKNKQGSPSKKGLDITTNNHQSPSKVVDNESKLLLTPTSISMKNAFIIKNADVSFDAYYSQMKKRRGGSPGRLNQSTFNNSYIASPEKEQAKVKIISEKQPTGRDGHSACLAGSKWIVFGGDRHHMPFNDTYVLDLDQLIKE